MRDRSARRRPVLHIHRAERADGLLDALGGLLAEPLDDPFAADVVAVPTRGMERWLSQRLSARLGASPGRADGVCANVAFPSPRALVDAAIATASGVDPSSDPWQPERAVWPLLEVVGAHLEEPWLARLAAHLGAAGDEPDAERAGRRYAAVRHLADLFDAYALHRPEMVRAWAQGRDVGATGAALREDARWQPELWRRLADRIAAPDPAQRRERACARLREQPELVDLPARLALFGLTRLPAGHLEVLGALAAGREVHLLLLHPSPALWRRVATEIGGRAPIRRRDEDPTATLAGNRLLGSLGHDARELQLVLAGAPGDVADHHHETEHGGETLLARLQADVRADRPHPGPGGEDSRLALRDGDRSVEVHACHGRARQVEVLRDAVLHMLEDDPTLEPRDVIVMCPDVEAFAPLVHATFGSAEAVEAGEPGGDDPDAGGEDPDAGASTALRVRLADRSLRLTNPLLGVVAELLDLAGQRITASQVLDLADRAPVRRRFGFDDDDLARLADWVAGSGIRWGLDADHRARFRLGSLDAGTWRAGLERILLGVAMSEDERRLFAGVLPLDDVDSADVELAGRLAELVDRLRGAVEALSAEQTVDGWAAAVAAAADALAATGPRETWQRAELDRILDAVVAEATGPGGVSPVALSPPEARALLAERLRGRPTRANFRTGHLTICTLVPMRSVPHRVVCLLGMDDTAFPRRAPRDGDDLMLADPHVGDRDPRTEDRQMLLDALLAATERLVVTYTGNDERTNVRRPPAVPIGELLDAIDRTASVDEGRPSQRVVVRHPLQPFDPRNFADGVLRGGGPWSFDRVALDGARALTGPREPPAPFLAAPLPPREEPHVDLDELVAFAEAPVDAFLRQRLGIRATRDADEDEVEDALPVELSPLQRWSPGQRMLEAALAGVALEDAAAAELARGALPPGNLAGPVLDGLRRDVEPIAEAADALAASAGEPRPVDVQLELPGARTLSGTVPGVRGNLLLRVIFSRVGPKHRLAAWVRWLALNAAEPGRRFVAITVGRAREDREPGTRVTLATLPALAADPERIRERALAQLALLVDLRDRGLREPLPLACKASAAYARAARAGEDAVAAGLRAWKSNWKGDREDREPAHQLAFGGTLPFDDLLADAPRPDEDGDGWPAQETSRFGRYALRMWSGPLSHETVIDR